MTRKDPRPRHDSSRARTLVLLKSIAQAIVRTLGPDVCEVVIHDLCDLEHSIIWIEGDVTHRRIGDTMTDLGLSVIKSRKFDDLFKYRTNVAGKILNSSSVFLRDASGEVWGAFCINLNITPMLQIDRFLESWTMINPAAQVTETFSRDIEDVLETMIADCASKIGKPVDEMSRAERIELIRMLEREGAFQVRRAAPIVARHLGTSRYTIYNYLAEARGEKTSSEPVPGLTIQAGKPVASPPGKRKKRTTVARSARGA